MLRARHIDEIKDMVDVEIVLGDTVRIGTDEKVISAARAGALNHGYSKVKVVTTKIDVRFSGPLIRIILLTKSFRFSRMTSFLIA